MPESCGCLVTTMSLADVHSQPGIAYCPRHAEANVQELEIAIVEWQNQFGTTLPFQARQRLREPAH